jgi:tetratricopeptide (TPR) repeat protein
LKPISPFIQDSIPWPNEFKIIQDLGSYTLKKRTVKLFKTLFFSVLFLTIAISAQAQVPELIKNEQFRTDARAAVDSLYNFSPEGADERLASWKEEYPSHPLWQLMDGMEFWWILLSDLNDTSHDVDFFEMMKKADYAASKLLYDEPGHADALIIRTVANGYIARQHSNREEWVTSLNTARKAYNAYGYLQENMSELPDLKLAEGLKLYYSEYLPEAYPVVKTVSWFLPDGDKKKGLKEMRDAAQTAIFARAEASYFLGNINYNYENQYNKAAGYFKSLHEAYPNNNYYARLLVKNYYKMGRYEDALAVADSALKRWDSKDLPYNDVLREELLFWKGRILYKKNMLEEALPLFKESHELSSDLPRSRNRGYYPASAYFAGRTLAKMGTYDEARSFFESVLDAKTGDGYKKMARERLERLEAGE